MRCYFVLNVNSYTYQGSYIAQEVSIKCTISYQGIIYCPGGKYQMYRQILSSILYRQI
jgi:hypothetical protein